MRCSIRRGIALGVLACSFGGTALAQTDVSTKAAAEGLFDQGREAMKKGDFAEACGLLERSQQIDPAVGTLLYLAECYEKSGRTASAWATFRDAAASARAVGQNDRARLAEDRADRLTPSLSKLTIEVGEITRSIPGLVVRRHGQTIPPAAWNVPVPLDPGKYRIEASAPGHLDFSETVEVGERAALARIAVPPLTASESTTEQRAALGATPGPVGFQGQGSSVAHGPSPVSSPERDDGKTQRIVAYALGGVGVVGVGLGSFFGVGAISKNDDAKEYCPSDNRCTDQAGLSLTDEASDAATISNVAFGLGLAALAGGVVLYLTAPDASSEKPALAATIGPSGVSLEGVF